MPMPWAFLGDQVILPGFVSSGGNGPIVHAPHNWRAEVIGASGVPVHHPAHDRKNVVGHHGAVIILNLVQHLALRVGAKRKTWTLHLTVAGKRQRLTLGSYPSMSLASARAKVLTIAEDANLGAQIGALKDQIIDLGKQRYRVRLQLDEYKRRVLEQRRERLSPALIERINEAREFG
jgi:hypothetical protein